MKKGIGIRKIVYELERKGMIKPASARWHAPAFGGFCSRQEHSYVCEVEIGVIEDSG